MPAALIATVYAYRREEIATQVASLLKSSNAPYYREMRVADLSLEAAEMVAAFIDSIAGEPGQLAAYVEDVADARLTRGFLLGELQGALKVLEGAVWRLTVELVPEAHQIEAFSRITAAVSAARDRLTRVYLERSLRAETEVVQLKRRIEAGEDATDRPAVDETDPD